jgi:PAS domain S-box-containing protein
VLLGAAVALAYVATAQLGFRVAFSAEQVTTVWAPTGIAIAALTLGGSRLGPGVWIGAFAANAATHAPLWTSLLIASGNTAEALAASWALRRLGLRPALGSVRDVLALVGASVACTTISATAGVATLSVAGLQPWERFASLWFDWWLGDVLGAIVVAPVVLTVVGTRWLPRRAAETAAFAAASLALAHAIFGSALGTEHPLEYALFPLVVAAAMRGPAESSLAVLAASAIAIFDTVRGLGPFAGPTAHHGLVLLQMFTAALATTTLLLSAAVDERRSVERRATANAEALARREEMLRLAQQTGGVATFEWDFAQGAAHCSEEFFRMFGLEPRPDGRISTDEWGRFTHPDDLARMTAHLGAVLAGTEPAAADYRIVTVDGRTRWLSYAGRLQRTPAGERLLGTVLDITARKRDEIALRDAMAAAQSANRLKDDFLATLSHELRTPLTAILGYARLLRGGSVPPEMQRRAIDVIERNARAQADLVEELLDMSRVSAGKVLLETELVTVAAILQDAVDALRPSAESKDVHIAVDASPDIPLVAADPARLRQVFTNLLGNAVKFTDRGGRITASVRSHGTHVAIAVSDTGVGIAADFLPFVFEPFRQADVRFDGGRGGLGLGLALSRQLVELHGGTIAAASGGPGLGATFTVRLPAAAIAAPA